MISNLHARELQSRRSLPFRHYRLSVASPSPSTAHLSLFDSLILTSTRRRIKLGSEILDAETDGLEFYNDGGLFVSVVGSRVEVYDTEERVCVFGVGVGEAVGQLAVGVTGVATSTGN